MTFYVLFPPHFKSSDSILQVVLSIRFCLLEDTHGTWKADSNDNDYVLSKYLHINEILIDFQIWNIFLIPTTYNDQVVLHAGSTFRGQV